MKEFANVNLNGNNDFPIIINDEFKRGFFIFVSDEQDFDLALDKGDFKITYLNEKLAFPGAVDMLKWLIDNSDNFPKDSFYHVVYCSVYDDYIENLSYITTYGGLLSDGCI